MLIMCELYERSGTLSMSLKMQTPLRAELTSLQLGKHLVLW